MNPHARLPSRARGALLMCATLCPMLTHCASSRAEVALHSSVPTTQAARGAEGVGARASVRGVRGESRALSLAPTASFSVSTRALTTLALGIDLRLQLDPERFDTPFPLLLSAGFDALNMGCQGIPQCHIGAAGVHGEVGVVVLTHPRAGAWSVSVGLDQDVRFGPRSDTSWLAGVRWTPAAH